MRLAVTRTRARHKQDVILVYYICIYICAHVCVSIYIYILYVHTYGMLVCWFELLLVLLPALYIRHLYNSETFNGWGFLSHYTNNYGFR